MPKGVSSPCGLVTRTTEPTVAPRLSAMSLPRMMGGMAATRAWTAAREWGEEGWDCGGSASLCFGGTAEAAVATWFVEAVSTWSVEAVSTWSVEAVSTWFVEAGAPGSFSGPGRGHLGGGRG